MELLTKQVHQPDFDSTQAGDTPVRRFNHDVFFSFCHRAGAVPIL